MHGTHRVEACRSIGWEVAAGRDDRFAVLVDVRFDPIIECCVDHPTPLPLIDRRWRFDNARPHDVAELGHCERVEILALSTQVAAQLLKSAVGTAVPDESQCQLVGRSAATSSSLANTFAIFSPDMPRCRPIAFTNR